MDLGFLVWQSFWGISCSQQQQPRPVSAPSPAAKEPTLKRRATNVSILRIQSTISWPVLKSPPNEKMQNLPRSDRPWIPGDKPQNVCPGAQGRSTNPRRRAPPSRKKRLWVPCNTSSGLGLIWFRSGLDLVQVWAVLPKMKLLQIGGPCLRCP